LGPNVQACAFLFHTAAGRLHKKTMTPHSLLQVAIILPFPHLIYFFFKSRIELDLVVPEHVFNCTMLFVSWFYISIVDGPLVISSHKAGFMPENSVNYFTSGQ